MVKSIKEIALGSMYWKFTERILSQGITFIVSILLARQLSPSEYGIIAVANIFITFSNVFVVSGFNSALIQKRNADDLDFSTMFYCSLFISVILYILIFSLAPHIASYYGMPKMKQVLRVFSLILIFNSYYSIQQSYIARHMMFRKSMYATFFSSILSGTVGVIMAYKGFGVWSLVVQYLLSVLISILILMAYVDWFPSLSFSSNRARTLLNYGGKIMASSFIGTLYYEIRALVIGVYYSPTDLALYDRGRQLPKIITNNIDSSLQSVLFPMMSNYADNPVVVKQMLKRAITTSSYITYFFLSLMAVASEPLIKILLTDKWLDCVPYMRIFCISMMLLTISTNNIQALKAIGKSGEVLKIEMFKKPVFLLVVIIALPFGVFAIALTTIFNSLYALWTNMGPTARYLNYSKKEQIKDLLPSLFLSCLMIILIWPISFIPINTLLIMIIQCLVAPIVYIGFSILFHIEGYYYCKNLLLEILYKKTKKKI